MGVSVWFIVLIVLTTGKCFQTVESQDDSSPAAGLPIPIDILDASADTSPNDSSPDISSQPDTSPTTETSLVDSPPVDNAPANTSPADSASPDTSPSDSSTADISPADVSTSNPPAVFVFGDSLVDPGNNNHIQTLAKANMLFNGIDYPGGPTGRFCNGRTVVDILCDILGVPYPPPFLDAETTGSRLLRGVNYASGAGGILDATGADFLNRICMNQQISFFQETTLPELQALLGTNTTSTLLASSLVTVIMGSNDYINNYLLGDSVSTQYTPVQFNVLLINSFRRQLMELYESGFRMFFVSGIGPLGCIPHQLAISGQPTCVSSVNAQAQDFNGLVLSTLQELNSELPDAMYLFGNSYNTLITLINNPGKYGFAVVNEGCCGGGTYRAQVLCQPTAEVCSNRKEYVFWDAYHPTEAANLVLAKAVYTGGPNAVTPMNVQQLLALKALRPT